MEFSSCTPVTAFGVEDPDGLPSGISPDLDAVILEPATLLAAPRTHEFYKGSDARFHPVMQGDFDAVFAGTGIRVIVPHRVDDLEECSCGGRRLPAGGHVLLRVETVPGGSQLALMGHQSGRIDEPQQLPSECVPLFSMIFVRSPCVIVSGDAVEIRAEYWQSPESTLGMLRERGTVVPRADGTGRDVYFGGLLPVGIDGPFEH